MPSVHSLVNFLSSLVQEPGIYGAIGLFTVAAVDELVAFIPSSLVFTAEVLFLKVPLTVAGLSQLTVFVGLPVALGSMVGSLPLFLLAYAGGKPAIEAAHKRWKLSWADVDRFTQSFRGDWRDEMIFLFFRALPLMPTLPITVIAGTMRMKPATYMLLTVLGIMIRVVITLVLLRTGSEVFAHMLRGGNIL